MTTHTPVQTSPPTVSAKALSFDERLTLAALAVDARINTRPLDLADVIRIPVAAPQPAIPSPYSTPIAGALYRARHRIVQDGWCRDNVFDGEGAICPIRAIRLEAASRRDADDACVLLLDVIQAAFPTAETIPSWNAAQTSPAPVLLAFDRAATRAHAHSL